MLIGTDCIGSSTTVRSRPRRSLVRIDMDDDEQERIITLHLDINLSNGTAILLAVLQFTVTVWSPNNKHDLYAECEKAIASLLSINATSGHVCSY